MITGIILTVAAGLLWGVAGILFSQVIRHGLKSESYYLLVLGTMFVSMAVFRVRWPLLLSGDVPYLGRLTAAMALSGVTNIIGMMLMMRAMRTGHQGISWTIGQSAMIVPFLASVVFFGDVVPGTKYAGVILILVTLGLLGSAKAPGARAGIDMKWLMTVLSCLLLVGVSQMLNILPGRWPGFADTANLRIATAVLAGAVTMLAVSIYRKSVPQRKTVRLALLGGVNGVFSQILMFKGIDLLAPAGLLSIAYPLGVSVCIVSFALYSRMVLKEHFGHKETVAVVLGVIGIGLMAVS